MRHIVYTSVMGDYDRLNPPAIVEACVDYVVFSDDPHLQVPAPWEIRPLLRRERNSRMTARWHKGHPHLLFPEHELSLYIDANIVLKAPVSPLIEKMSALSPIALFRHPERACPYEEAEIVKRYRLDDAAIVDAQMAYYKAQGYPANAGLHNSGVQVRRHGDSRLVAFLEDWWRQLKVFSHRDQLSLDFMLLRHGIDVATIPGQMKNSPWFAIAPHRRSRVHRAGTQSATAGDELDWLRTTMIVAAANGPRRAAGAAIVQSLWWHAMEPLRAAKRWFHLLAWRQPSAGRSGEHDRSRSR